MATSLALTPALRVMASYTYSHFVFVDDGIDTARYEGNLLPGVPPHHLLTRLEGQVGTIVIEPELEYSSAYFSNDANTADSRNAAFAVVNLRVRTRRPVRAGASPFAAIDNVFDARYNASVVINAAGARYFEPAPGRNFYLGLAVQAGTSRRWP